MKAEVRSRSSKFGLTSFQLHSTRLRTSHFDVQPFRFSFFRDAQLVVDAGGAHRTGEQIGSAAVGGGANDAGERRFAVAHVDVDHRPAAAGGHRKRAVLLDPFQDQVLQLVVMEHAGLGPANGFGSHIFNLTFITTCT